MACYYAKPVGTFVGRTHPMNRLQVIGPGERIHLDFLTSPKAADALATKMNLQMAEGRRKLVLPPNQMIQAPGIVTIDQALREHEASRAARKQRIIGKGRQTP